MMQLRTSGASPFGRKVQLAAAIAGLSDQIEVIATDTSDPACGLSDLNPLGKIPALTLDGGATYFDSRVIVEYLDHLAGGDVLIPKEPRARFKDLTLAALADGVMEASLLQIYESRRRAAAKQDPLWLDWQSEKVARGLAAFAAAPPSGRRTAGHIGLAAALGYLDLRFEGRWRKDYPELTAWLAAFAAEVPAFAATAA
ncbi:glutathione S-transferase family protein [Methylocella silvestris]|uniref:Glutathione S-transferase n=1 Tax=Methylocella silvestris TaxID=199596 RepID=A0A2J7TCV4_METSI|nr:glutathione S-transferase N-terminal domain-containing protein [Methylocella silvestris]PNG24606.1 glutathione S-transferase [Methylocella silvestris]